MGKWVVCVSVVGLTMAMTAHAEESELDALRRMVDHQQQVIEGLMKRIEALEQERVQPVSPERIEEVTPPAPPPSEPPEVAAPPAPPSEPKKPRWTDRVAITGDLRYRFQHVDLETKAVRNFHRIRSRIALEAQVTDEFDMGFGLVTGSDSPASGNQTLTGGYSSKDIFLDLVYFDWHPDEVEGLHLTGGKMRNPFYRPGRTQLIWDSEVRPEGLALRYSRSIDVVDLFGTVGFFQLEERAEDVDTTLWGAQAGLKVHLFDKAHLTGGLSSYNYHDIKGRLPIYNPEGSYGNSVDWYGCIKEDFNELEVFANLDLVLGRIPVALFGDYVINTAADNDKAGWLAGFRVGDNTRPKSWYVWYTYRDLEQDAVVGLFSDSDSGGGGTNIRGHKVGLGYAIAKPVRAEVVYFLNDRIRRPYGKLKYERVQLQLILEF